jgi:hypothetical protein
MTKKLIRCTAKCFGFAEAIIRPTYNTDKVTVMCALYIGHTLLLPYLCYRLA